MFKAFPGALARHFHQAQVRDASDFIAGRVTQHGFFQASVHLPAMLGILHVDEVHDDNAAQVAQAQLARERRRRFQIGLENRFCLIALADKRTGIHIYGGHGLGLVDDQVTSRFKLNFTPQCPLDIVLNTMQVKQGAFAGIVLQQSRHFRHVINTECPQGRIALAAVD